MKRSIIYTSSELILALTKKLRKLSKDDLAKFSSLILEKEVCCKEVEEFEVTDLDGPSKLHPVIPESDDFPHEGQPTSSDPLVWCCPVPDDHHRSILGHLNKLHHLALSVAKYKPNANADLEKASCKFHFEEEGSTLVLTLEIPDKSA